MPTTIHSVTARWVDYAPDSAEAVVEFEESAGEKLIRWGVPVTADKNGLGFQQSTEPVTVDVGEEFSLGPLRYLNNIVYEPLIQTAVLEITLRYTSATGPTAVFNLTFELQAGSGGVEDVVVLSGILPIPITVGDTQLSVLGFTDLDSGLPTEQLLIAENDTAAASLRIKLLSSPTASPACESGFTPVFVSTRCEIPPVCPIEPLDIIEDCGIPEPLEPITDCPDIDLPVPMLFGAGQDGQDGQDGQNGCTPSITYSYQWFLVLDCSLSKVEITSFAVPPCGTHFIFKFWLCAWNCLYAGCCRFIWCEGIWVAIDDETNPFYCALLGVPPVDGRFEGEMVYYCDCNPPTTTSTTTTTTTTQAPEETTTTTAAPAEVAVWILEPEPEEQAFHGEEYTRNAHPGSNVAFRVKNLSAGALTINYFFSGDYVFESDSVLLFAGEETILSTNVIGAVGFRSSNIIFNGAFDTIEFTLEGAIT